MQLIIITREEISENEPESLNRLFDAGLQILHIRKPKAGKKDVASLIGEISENFHSRIVLHDHFELVREFELKGIHLNRRNPSPFPFQGISVSSSCHSLAEVETFKPKCHYVFLSPVFNSISKSGYSGAFSGSELLNAHSKGIIDKKVIALGGITPENIPLVSSYGFGGVAILGGIWGKSFENKEDKEIMERFTVYQKICKKL